MPRTREAESLETVAWMLGFVGFDFEVFDFEVHEPPELIDHLRRMSERLCRAAGCVPRSCAKMR